MLKKIIFDVDDTLIANNEEENIKSYEEVLAYFDMPNSYEDVLKLYNAIDEYDKYTKAYETTSMHKFLEQYLKQKLPSDFVSKVNETIASKWITKTDETLVNALKNLSKRYDLYVLTNYFASVQAKRLENMDLLKYFKEVVGADACVKTNLASYKYFTTDCSSSECLMIGNSLTHDIYPAQEVGMHTLVYNPKRGSIPKNLNQINNWWELENIIKEIDN